MIRRCMWIAFGLLTCANAAHGENATWIGGTGNWSDESRWSSNPDFPNNGSATFDVQISAGNITQDVASGVTIDSLAWTGGRIFGSQPITVLNSIDWSNGELLNSAGLVVDAGATLTHTGTSTQHSIGNNSLLSVDGAFRLVGSSLLNTGATVGNGAKLEILDGGLFDLQGDGGLSDTYFNNFSQVRVANVENSGLWTKSSGLGISLITDDWKFENRPTGVVEVQSGTLHFSEDGNGFVNDGVAEVHAGTLSVGGGQSTRCRRRLAIQHTGIAAVDRSSPQWRNHQQPWNGGDQWPCSV
jgi:hypothetical protein